jgi:hypothetical protein
MNLSLGGGFYPVIDPEDPIDLEYFEKRNVIRSIPAIIAIPSINRDSCIFRVLLPALFFTVAPARIPADFDKDVPPTAIELQVSFRKSAG